MTQISGSQINFTTFLGFLHNWYFLSATPTFLTGSTGQLIVTCDQSSNYSRDTLRLVRIQTPRYYHD